MNGFTWNKECEGYFSRHRLSNGQFCMIGFYRHKAPRAIEYHVAFAVADKKKILNAWFNGTAGDTITLRMTGRCGLEALYWCRNKLLEFECEVHQHKSVDTKIVVAAEDSKRFRIYKRALARYGYQKVKYGNNWEIVKFLPHQGGQDGNTYGKRGGDVDCSS